MSLAPGYGETPVSDDELEWLLPEVRRLLGEPVTKAAVYDLEQALQEGVTERLVSYVLDGSLSLELLRRYDSDRDPRPLAAFVPVQPFGD